MYVPYGTIEYSSTYTCAYLAIRYVRVHVYVNAPDLAAGDVGGAGVVAEGNDSDAIFGSVHRHAEDANYVD